MNSTLIKTELVNLLKKLGYENPESFLDIFFEKERIKYSTFTITTILERESIKDLYKTNLNSFLEKLNSELQLEVDTSDIQT